jgi:hypothetical protein
MYKIYINEIPVTLLKSELVTNIRNPNNKTLILPYLGKPTSLHQMIKVV